ncbi:MAG: MBL fold metallo-hydrolase [Paramuribaculum sp.]|nr:MBL fold metallo-hydrolase [Paramuribaculum sp.]
MNITIHRGTDQIGGCVTEYEYNGWRLFVDYGEQLPGTPEISLQVEGLTHGDLSRSALLITHYHGDHVGCITDLPEELPIYIGKTAKEILEGLSEHLGYVDKRQATLNARLKSVNTFSPGRLLDWGEFQIMPIIMDHSAFDAYAFRIEAGGLKVFHTGDFRTHGFRGRKIPEVIEKYVGKVDYMVCEATNVCRSANNIKPEQELQKEFIQAFTENKYNVVYLSSTNIDRLFGLYHAALKAKRPFYVDSYQKKIMDIVAVRDTIWGKSRLYRYKDGREPKVLHRDGDNFRVNEKFVDFLSDRGYVVIARAGKRFDAFLSHIPADGRITYLSMWDGYLDKSKTAYNPMLAKSVGVNYKYFHTSGHCDMESLENLVEMLRTKAIIPIHTDSPKTFAELFSDRYPVLIMKDGDTFRPIKDSGVH